MSTFSSRAIEIIRKADDKVKVRNSWLFLIVFLLVRPSWSADSWLKLAPADVLNGPTCPADIAKRSNRLIWPVANEGGLSLVSVQLLLHEQGFQTQLFSNVKKKVRTLDDWERKIKFYAQRGSSFYEVMNFESQMDDDTMWFQYFTELSHIEDSNSALLFWRDCTNLAFDLLPKSVKRAGLEIIGPDERLASFIVPLVYPADASAGGHRAEIARYRNESKTESRDFQRVTHQLLRERLLNLREASKVKKFRQQLLTALGAFSQGPSSFPHLHAVYLNFGDDTPDIEYQEDMSLRLEFSRAQSGSILFSFIPKMGEETEMRFHEDGSVSLPYRRPAPLPKSPPKPMRRKIGNQSFPEYRMGG